MYTYSPSYNNTHRERGRGIRLDLNKTYRRQLLVVPLHRLVDRLRLAAIDQQGVRGVLLLEVDDDGASLDGLVKREARHVVRADDDDGLICSLVEHS